MAADKMVAAVGDVRTVIEQLLAEGVLQAHPTFFEVTTAVALELFRRAGVDMAVLEVGLGGRLDATNVIEPVATANADISAKIVVPKPCMRSTRYGDWGSVMISRRRSSGARCAAGCRG